MNIPLCKHARFSPKSSITHNESGICTTNSQDVYMHAEHKSPPVNHASTNSAPAK